mgnify:CR=1 FL=1
MEVNNLTFGQKIKRFRLINDIRQEDMAEKMGVSRATLINYEKGHTKITVDALEKLKQAFPKFILDETDKEKPKILQDNIIDFRLLFEILFKKKRFILLLVFFMSLSGFASSYIMKKQYTAKITLYPAKNDGMQGMGQFQALAMNLGINASQGDQSFNISDVVKSRLIAEKSIKQTWINSLGTEVSLIDLWGLNKEPLFKFSNEKAINKDIIEEKAIRKFDKHIFVNEDRITGLITISTKLEDPIIVASLANFVGRQIQNYIQKENSAQSTKEKLFIGERLSVVKKELESSEFDLKEFKESNRGYEDSPELFMIFSRLFREAEAKKEVYLTLQQQLELARIEEVRQSPILHILDSATPPIRKSSPNRLMFLIIAGVIGAISSSIIVLYKY